MTHHSTERIVPSGAMLIGDRWVGDSSLGRPSHINPATGKVLGSFALAGPREIDEAVRAARAAFGEWRGMVARDRRRILQRIAQLLEERVEEHNTLRAHEAGVPFKVPPDRRWLAAEYFHYYSGWVDKLRGESPPAYSAPSLDYTIPEPYGVVAVIVPWNAPVMSAAMKAAPALAAGNCVVLKPSDLGPFTPQLFGQLCLDAGLPPGVLNVLPGGQAAGEALVSHPGVDKISFTGGGATATAVMSAAARNLTPVTLELGGKSANIVFPDADLDAAAAMACQTGIVNVAGQGCNLPTRLLVHDTVYDDVVERVVSRAGALKIGLPFDPSTQMGPVISESACLRILAVIAQAVAEKSGKLLIGGRRLSEDLADGFFIAPTVFGEVDNASRLAQEEVFGPVLSILRFRDEDEALALANGTRYGLAGYVWTSDVKRAHRVAAALDAGWIGVNGFPPMPPNAPFGGVKQSGFGREGGAEGIFEFVRVKNVHVDLN
ncbi:MAG: aldehyde dehydrogenase family protein [Actinomycetota bacterium]